MTMKIRKVTGIGNVMIPKEYRDQMGLQAGDQVLITCQDNKLIITKVDERKLAKLINE
ncbi:MULTISPECIES: AbrB/MazE/SpoVT family DNA-binding domain-containing protein [Thermoactinomyces]|uniref:AbrB/MazE/SpoVT family DNA-binding domain-containing protein n=1 Tax=Thermoactinomyces daqus TaxID=1329516 RepID=A0A7W1XDF8_9BACL|nr:MULTISPECIES: AbrB/MazE/SpoVT family DNA-binding domain-containing protein [Thermoactinomyces]MBA4544578.1 AbrB/MazE/SpoVT family DNA-binding domain-containing protein [Thermoactinomyces daqus]MBH8599732.1 AbrB/MazE/SpoVT family DNA-binding domain-containing protein [Thermoactinomyces sp. CICC 10523]MBH8605942.1 AbrB/MazE/SpoVT family DNA-binding domain-containing protein [Thermoactinomyces sp. CICC 10522]MBH8609440.1 AbrB/MazE/SpoVT family DNA-binding domain-containing protein [Thermoactino